MQNIAAGEIALVPRSKGGFCYGIVDKPTKLSCILSDQPRHQVTAVRAFLELSTPEDPIDNPLHKDLVLIFVGRLGAGATAAASATPKPALKVSPNAPGSTCGECEEVGFVKK